MPGTRKPVLELPGGPGARWLPNTGRWPSTRLAGSMYTSTGRAESTHEEVINEAYRHRRHEGQHRVPGGSVADTRPGPPRIHPGFRALRSPDPDQRQDG